MQVLLAIFRKKNLNPLSDRKQFCLVPNPNSQSSEVLGLSFSVRRNGLCVSVLLNTLYTTVSIQRGRIFGYALTMRTDYEEMPSLNKHRVKVCPTHTSSNLVLKMINELESLYKIFSKRSEASYGLLSCSKFPEQPKSNELVPDKPVLPEKATRRLR